MTGGGQRVRRPARGAVHGDRAASRLGRVQPEFGQRVNRISQQSARCMRLLAIGHDGNPPIARRVQPADCRTSALRAVASVNIKDSRGISVTNRPISQPSPVGDVARQRDRFALRPRAAVAFQEAPVGIQAPQEPASRPDRLLPFGRRACVFDFGDARAAEDG